AAELSPRVLPTIRVAPLPAAGLEPALESTSKPAVGSRRLSALAAVALGVAAWTLGLGHHELLPASATSSPAPSASAVLAAPPSRASASVAPARNEITDPARPQPRPVAPHRQRI
ncbi:MAG TPA: hypothetical protein VF334_00035, partial [Polyangia bacterium]